MTADEKKARKLALESVLCVVASLPLSVIVCMAAGEFEGSELGPLLLAWGWDFDVSAWFLLPRCLFLFGIWCGLRTLFMSEEPRSGIVRIASVLAVVLVILLILAKLLVPRVS